MVLINVPKYYLCPKYEVLNRIVPKILCAEIQVCRLAVTPTNHVRILTLSAAGCRRRGFLDIISISVYVVMRCVARGGRRGGAL